ncbi:MAG TPA: glutamate synthase-related protein [Methylomirabilota bacterium]|nr:glutamate synthase-related protein [Methylomirabilota bacterium]
MRYVCSVCGYVYDEDVEGVPLGELPEGWVCPVCTADASFFEPEGDGKAGGDEPSAGTGTDADADAGSLRTYLAQWRRESSPVEADLAVIQEMAITGESVLDPMRTTKPVPSWDGILICGAQLATLPLNDDEPVSTRTVIGPRAKAPLVLETPVTVSHMSFGALSREAKIALAKGSAAVGTAMCSGEGGILPDSLAAAHRYIFEYIPNRYSVTHDNLRAVDAVEIKIGQSAKPGLGGHLPGSKVTDEIAAVRGFPAGQDIVSPARFPDIRDADELRAKVDWLREATGGKPIGVKLAAGRIEADLAVALAAGPDFVTVDGRPGATGAAPKAVKDAAAIPTIYALARARRFLDERGADGVSLIVTGGFRTSSDIAKALAMGADAVALASAALMAAGCQHYRICHTGRCPVGIATQDPELRDRLDIELSAQRVANFLGALTRELADFARLTGHDDVHRLSPHDLRTTSPEIARYTAVAHVGEPEANP